MLLSGKLDPILAEIQAGIKVAREEGARISQKYGFKG